MGIAQIMAEVSSEVAYLQKGGTNSAQGYKYARAQDVFLKVNEALSKRGVACVESKAEVIDKQTGLGKSGNGILFTVRITQTYRHDESGETATFQGLGSGADTQDKGAMKASTAALKYLLTNAFNISWGDDPEASEMEPPEKGESKPKAARPATPKKLLAALKKDIDKAADLGSLEELKSRVLKFDNQSAEYQEAKDYYVARKNALAA